MIALSADIQAIIEDIRAQMVRIEELAKRLEATQRGTTERAGLRWKLHAAHDVDRALAEQAAETFARERGWRLARTPFSPRQLMANCPGRQGVEDYGLSGDDPRHLDHGEHFRWPERPYRPAGIVAHLYDEDFSRHAEWAAWYGLAAEPLSESWYYPGQCLAVLYTRASDIAEWAARYGLAAEPLSP